MRLYVFYLFYFYVSPEGNKTTADMGVLQKYCLIYG